jgi:predicted HicB family RNase H-like nuclease
MTLLEMVMDTLYTQAKSNKFMLRLPDRMKEEIRRMAEMDGISINSAIVQRLAKSLREERISGQ